MPSFFDLLGMTSPYAGNPGVPWMGGENILQGIGQALMAPGNALKSTPDNPVTTEQMIAPAANLAGLTTLGTGAAPAEANSLNMGIRAYHGSPYDFDRFDLSKVGTGEGAQAYGHGLYFAENPAVAEEYKKNLSVAQLEKFYSDLTKYGKADRPTPPVGHMYEVNINADPSQFLNYDTPLTRQPQIVKDALAKVGVDVNSPTLREDINRAAGLRLSPYAPTGNSYFQDLPGAKTAAASQVLSREGVPGIRYLDQGSRGMGTGTSNYVVFNPDIIDILKKYGIAGLGAGLTAAQLPSSNVPQVSQ